MCSAAKPTGVTRTLSMEPQERDDVGASGRSVEVGAQVLSGFAGVCCPVSFSVESGEPHPMDTEPDPSRQHL